MSRSRLLIASLFLAPIWSGGVERPNVIVIMADDLGFGDVSCYGATALKTPNIDLLAAEGQRFTSGYCTASTCTPTRFSFLTGTYAFREKGTGIAAPNAPAIIKPGTTTIASLFKSVGYETAVIGKWHLGLGDPEPQWNGELKPGPLEIGFDHCFLLPTTNDRVPQVFVQDHRVLNLDVSDPLRVGNKQPAGDHPTGITHRDSLKMDWSHGHNQTIHNGISRIGFYTGGKSARFRDEDLADRWVEESVKWMETRKEKPFFLFFAAHDIHVPRIPHERFQGKTSLGLRGDSILQFDWCVGELMAALDRMKLAENTMILLCSDNGPVLDDGYRDGAVEKLGGHQPAGPYSGGKYSVLEGGTRTPFITRWKGRIPSGVSDQIVSTVDLAASFASMAGAAMPKEDCRDSINVLPALLGQSGATGREHILQQDNGSGAYGLRVGDWKLVRQKAKPQTQAVVDRKKARNQKGPHALHFLPEDPGEETDVSLKNPEKMKELIAKMDALISAGRSRDL